MTRTSNVTGTIAYRSYAAPGVGRSRPSLRGDPVHGMSLQAPARSGHGMTGGMASGRDPANGTITLDANPLVMRCLRDAAVTGLLDALSLSVPHTPDEIAVAKGLDPRAVWACLAGLAHAGIVTVEGAGYLLRAQDTDAR